MVSHLQKLRPHLRQQIFEARIRLKWLADQSRLPLTPDHWELYTLCHQLCWRELGDLPNLVDPRDFNDRIQWLKLFDQAEDHVRCSDKIRVRDYVRERVGEQHLTQLYETCNTFDQIDFDQLPKSFVIKTNHDSGGVVVVRDKAKFDRKAARNLIERNLRTVYGWNNGEWAYAFVEPKILVEELIGAHLPAPPPDFKFHCAGGKIQWLQYIYDRKQGTKEVIVSSEGLSMGCHFDHNMFSTSNFTKPPQWKDLCCIAEALAEGWKYVRVDLYLDDNRIIAGELTFFPLFGCYKSEGQKVLGQLLNFDRTTFKPPIYHKLKLPRHVTQRSE